MKHSAKLLIALGLAWGVSAQAESVSYLLTQSNELLDGPTYLTVTISDSITFSGDIDFSVATNPYAFNLTEVTNFGIQAFGFNPSGTIGTIDTTNIVNLTDNWTIGSGNLDGFGSFAVTDSSGRRGIRQDPLTFSIRVGGDSIYSYANPSTGNAGSWEGSGAAFFAAHVAGFASTQGVNGLVTSAFFAGSTIAPPPSEVPVPAAAWLLGSGLLGLVSIARRKAV